MFAIKSACNNKIVQAFWFTSRVSTVTKTAKFVAIPLSLTQVVNVTDFDGKFEAKGIPSMGGSGAADLAKKLKALKPPKRPKQPAKPKLQAFKATMPQYAEECLNYQDSSASCCVPLEGW